MMPIYWHDAFLKPMLDKEAFSERLRIRNGGSVPSLCEHEKGNQ